MFVLLLLVLIGFSVTAERRSDRQVQPGHPCANRTCVYGTTCTANAQNSDICECMRGFRGDNCSDINECKNGKGDPCGHRGFCINTVGSYRCQCLEGWNGSHTHCKDKTTSQQSCMPGYSGNDCKVSACEHGYAVNDSNGIICYCDNGWTHDHANDICSKDIDECVNNTNLCKNGGTCQNTNGSYFCKCIIPWQGHNCSFYNNCLSNPCEHASTTDTTKKTHYESTMNQLYTETDEKGNQQPKGHITLKSTKTATSDKSSSRIPLIIGATVGSIAAVIACGVLGYIVFKRTRAKISPRHVEEENEKTEMPEC